MSATFFNVSCKTLCATCLTFSLHNFFFVRNSRSFGRQKLLRFLSFWVNFEKVYAFEKFTRNGKVFFLHFLKTLILETFLGKNNPFHSEKKLGKQAMNFVTFAFMYKFEWEVEEIEILISKVF